MNKKMTYWAIVLCILCFAGAIAILPETQSAVGKIELQNRLPESLFDVLSKADSAIGLFAESADSAVLLNQGQIKELKNIILSDETYMFDFTKEAVFVPSVNFLFKYHEEQVVVTLSFHAEQIAFQYKEKRIVLDCDPGFKELKKFSENLSWVAP
jgi:hypothetical protein